MKSILEDIKNQTFQPVYLLYGEEDYLRKQYRDRLIQALAPQDDGMNVSRFEGKGLDVREVISLGDTMPFFADRRVILLEDTGFFKTQCPELTEYLGQLPDYLVILFVETEVDKRNRLFKAAGKYGRAVEFARQKEDTLTRWILGMLKREHKQITQRSMDLLLERTGTEMNQIEKELEKLFCYTMGRSVITAEDIEAVCTVRVTSQIFAMVQAVSDGDQKKALKLYYDLLELREPPMRILFLLARQFNQLLQIKTLQDAGAGAKEIEAKTGIRSFIVKKSQGCLRRYSEEDLRQAVEDFIQAEEDVKTGRLDDLISVELLITKYSGSCVSS